MAGAGYEHYEVSAYAKPGHRARHNLNYWEFGDYLGIGAGAHSKLSFPHRVLRQARYKQPGSFIEAARRAIRCRRSTRSRAPTWASSSCSTRCA
jgi:coproporphyrinogen III oxidase-like Fe-S oxidoreductase